MAIFDHPFIIKLHYSFQTKEKVFLITDYVPGGFSKYMNKYI